MRLLMERLAKLMALIGGGVLTALVVLTSVSIVGRGLNSLGHSDAMKSVSEGAADALIATGVGPIAGDFELVEAGVAFAIFSFLPLCQLYRGHATVDLFMWAVPRKASQTITVFWEIVLSAAILLVAWQLGVGMFDKLRTGEETFLLQIPVWQAYAASLFAAGVASIVAVYCAVARTAELITGRVYAPTEEGSVH